MNIPFIDLQTQYRNIKSEIDSAIMSVINEKGFIGGLNNKYSKHFESGFADYLGVKNCISCANGTDALEILLKAFGIGPGDEVIVPAVSWISTSEAVTAVGGTPIFVDTHPEYYTIDVEKIKKKITKQSKAIIPVHLYGLPAEMDEIISISHDYNLIVIEDCAQAHGAIYKGKIVGTIGNAGSFSFFPGKNLGAFGDAGCMVTNDDGIAEKCLMIANHGQLKKHEHEIEGRNSRMDGIQAAVLSVKLKYLKRWNDNRIRNADLYRQFLSETNIQLPYRSKYSKHVYHIFNVQLENRNKVQNNLNKENIETSLHYPTPLPLLKAYKRFNYASSDFPVACSLSKKLLSLPMYPELDEDRIRFISDIIKLSQ